jgi:hypothetical protein
VKRLIVGSALLMIVLFGLCSCSPENDQKDTYLKTGTYIIENSNGIIAAIPGLTLEEDNKFVFTYSVLSSNIPSGSYEIKDNKLVLSVDAASDEPVFFVFEIDGEKLIYRQGQSTELPAFAHNEIYDGAVFVLAASVPENH